MSVLVGSARIDENVNAHGGAAGDQTGKEVATQAWYLHSKGWVLLRPQAAYAEKIALAMERACANDKIGYDQYQRLTLYNAVKDKGFDPAQVTANVETDCSALVRVCCAFAGITADNFTTANEAAVLTATGKFTKYTDSKYTTASDYLQRGDVLVTKTTGHTVVVLSNGSKANGTTTSSGETTYTKAQFIKDVQTAIGVTVDGVAGAKTLAATPTLSAKKNTTHKAVKPVQKYLYALGYTQVGTADGEAGAKFTAAVKAYQTDKGCTADGEITAKEKTWKKLLGLA